MSYTALSKNARVTRSYSFYFLSSVYNATVKILQ